VERYSNLECIKLVLPWSTPSLPVLHFRTEDPGDRKRLAQALPRSAVLVDLLLAADPELLVAMDSNHFRAVTGYGRKMTTLETQLRNEEPSSVFTGSRKIMDHQKDTKLDVGKSCGCRGRLH
jgi:hypothetical protein